MKRMDREQLVERIRDAIDERFLDRTLDVWPDFTPEAEAVLAALGLDDLDAAVERAAKAWEPDIGTYLPAHANDALQDARRALEAALTATGEGESSVGWCPCEDRADGRDCGPGQS